jgi:hypothetical protein
MSDTQPYELVALLGGINIIVRDLCPPGKIALLQGQRLVHICSLGTPIEDAVFDGIIMNPTDFDRLQTKIGKHNSRAGIIRSLLKA